QIGMLAVMTGISLVFATKDNIYPFLSKSRRGWRRKPRLAVEQPAFLVAGGARIPLMMQNCSLTGVAAHGEAARLMPLLTRLAAHRPVTLMLQLGRKELQLPATVVWYRSDGPVVLFAVHTRATHVMEQFVDSVGKTGEGSAFAFGLARLWVKTSVRRAALAA